MTPKEIFQTIKDKDVKFVDLRFTDTRGKEQHVSVPVKAFGPDKFESGHFFDGSSIAGWKGIQASDMVLHARSDFLVHRSVPGADDSGNHLRRRSNRPTARATIAIHVRSPSAAPNI